MTIRYRLPGACPLLMGLLLAACDPNTTRPRVVPFPEDATTEVRARIPAATERLLAALSADSVPVSFQSTRDGYVETEWLDAETLKPTNARPIGPNVVRIRGWVNPAKEGFSTIIVEAAYRPYADPSLPERQLERPLPKDHPLQVKLDSMVARIPTNRAGTATPRPPAPDTAAIAPQAADSSASRSQPVDSSTPAR